MKQNSESNANQIALISEKWRDNMVLAYLFNIVIILVFIALFEFWNVIEKYFWI